MTSLLSTSPTLEYERELLAHGYQLVAGLDEVGRGSWAGPIVAAAVILPCADTAIARRLDGVRDSKQLTPIRREKLSTLILQHATAVGIGWASHHVIDRVGVAAANRRAMLRAVRNLPLQPDALLLDHFRLPETELPQVSVTKGDALCLSIAAASVVAKTVRDRWMRRSDRQHPGYGFERNKGYGTREHLGALEQLGPSRIHRRSFTPVASWSI